MPKQRTKAYQAYQQKRVRQRRIILLAIATLAVVVTSVLIAWGLLYTARPIFRQTSGDTSQFKALMEKDFGFFMAPSLLYYNNLDYTLMARNLTSSYRNKLLPILPVREDARLKSELEQLFAQYPTSRFTPHLYFYNPQDGSSVEINGYAPVPAASVIKLPILLDYLMSLDENVIRMDTPLLYAEFHRAGGSGDLQYKPAGQDFPANEIAGQMIRISDNTCTNIMISYLGGTDMVNRKLEDLGLRQTRIRNWLPDLKGTNTISPYEMTTILYNLDQGPLVSNFSRGDGLSILFSTHNRRLLVDPLPKEVKVAHKTGDIGTALGDSGAVYLPDGRKYFISMQVERPYNDYGAKEMMQKASRLIYDHVTSQQPTLAVQQTGGNPRI